MLCIIVLLHFWIVNDRHFLGPKEQELLAEAAEANACYFDTFTRPNMSQKQNQSLLWIRHERDFSSSHCYTLTMGCVTPEAPKPTLPACQCFARQNAGERRKKQKWSGSDWSVSQVSDFLGDDIECTE